MAIYIVSDIHLGSETCKSALLLQFFKEIHHSCSFIKIDNPDKYTWLKSFNYKQDSNERNKSSRPS